VRLRQVALFDAVINNSDRKGGHLLPAPSGRVYGIDHGVTFHSDDKLRTVLWTWRGERLNTSEVATLGRVRAGLDADLSERLAELVTLTEIDALRRRVDRLLDQGRFPMPSEDWPPIPWPPF
nr:phosphatidylinositol kinase [Micromonospora sp. DSM 115978]